MHKRRLAAAKPTCCGCKAKADAEAERANLPQMPAKADAEAAEAKLTADASESRSEAAGRAKLSADAKGKQMPKLLKEPNLAADLGQTQSGLAALEKTLLRMPVSRCWPLKSQNQPETRVPKVDCRSLPGAQTCCSYCQPVLTPKLLKS
jgi:hypothetical protein